MAVPGVFETLCKIVLISAMVLFSPLPPRLRLDRRLNDCSPASVPCLTPKAQNPKLAMFLNRKQCRSARRAFSTAEPPPRDSVRSHHMLLGVSCARPEPCSCLVSASFSHPRSPLPLARPIHTVLQTRTSSIHSMMYYVSTHRVGGQEITYEQAEM